MAFDAMAATPFIQVAAIKDSGAGERLGASDQVQEFL